MERLNFINAAGFFLRTLIPSPRKDSLIAIEIGLANGHFYLHEYCPELKIKTFESFNSLMYYVRDNYGPHNLSEFSSLANSRLLSHRENMEKINSWRRSK